MRGLTLWVDGRLATTQGHVPLDLPQGMHVLTLRVDLKVRQQDRLRCELIDVNGSPAQCVSRADGDGTLAGMVLQPQLDRGIMTPDCSSAENQMDHVMNHVNLESQDEAVRRFVLSLKLETRT